MVLWFATGVVLVMAAFPSLSSAILRGTQSNAPVVVTDANSAVLKVKIPSMDCAACAVSIQTKLRQQPGVVAAQVSYDTQEAVVQYDATKLAPENIIAMIEATGFKARPVK
jgi:Cu+-exporting ATPase